MKIIKGTIISPFGVHHHPTTTSATIHQGVDIAAVVGTPVYSPTKGIVKAIYEHGPAGRTTGPHLHYSVKNGGQWHDEQYIGGEFVDSAPFIEFQKA